MNSSPLRIARYCLLLLALPLLAALLPTPPLAARQQQPPITMQIEAGYGGLYRISHWFPVTFEVTNDGPDLDATIEWRFVGNEAAFFRRSFDLPRGARKRLHLNVVSSEFARAAQVRLLSSQTILAEQLVRLEPVDSSSFVVGVLSSDPTLLNSLAGMQLDRVASVSVAHLDPARLPEESLALNGLDALFVHDIATADLTPGQYRALDLWIRLGGQLVVSGGVSAERSTAGLLELLPAEPGQLLPDREVTSLQRIARRSDLAAAVPTTTISQTTPRPGARVIDPDGLLISADQGAGRVIFTAFDLAVLRPWPGEADLWQQLLHAENRMDLGYAYRWRSDNLLRNTLQLAGLQFPSSFVLILLMLLYIALIGPLNFLFLRRIGRPDLAWVTVPALVLLCLIGTYGASFLLRGARPQLLQLTVAQGFEGEPQGVATAFVGLFSPQRREYRLTIQNPALITSRAFDGFSRSEVSITVNDAASVVDDLLIDVSSLRTLIVERPGIEVPMVASRLQRTSDQVAGEVTYQGSTPLEDAMLVYGDSMALLGDMRPGQAEQVKLETGLNTFPDGAIGNDDQIFNRGQVLENLFGFDRFSFNGPNFDGTRGMPERDGVYLLGWIDTSLLPVTISDGNTNQIGMVLYIIRLNS